MKIWSTRLCRWVTFRGTRAAWIRLPHLTRAAALASACVATGAVLTAMPPPIARHAVVPRPARAASAQAYVLPVSDTALPAPYIPPDSIPLTLTPDAPPAFVVPEIVPVPAKPVDVPPPGLADPARNRNRRHCSG